MVCALKLLCFVAMAARRGICSLLSRSLLSSSCSSSSSGYGFGSFLQSRGGFLSFFCLISLEAMFFEVVIDIHNCGFQGEFQGSAHLLWRRRNLLLLLFR